MSQVCAVFGLSLALVFAGDIPSGPNVGDKLPECKVAGFSGPQAGKEFEVLKAAKNGPTLLIFVHEITRPGLQLLRPVDEYAAGQDRLATHIVWLGEREKTEAFLKRATNSLKLQSPVSVCLDAAGPQTYGLNDQVKMTILLANSGKVTANFAFTDPNGNDARKVVQALKKLLEKK